VKKLTQLGLCTLLSLSVLSPISFAENDFSPEEVDDHSSVFTPEEEEAYFKKLAEEGLETTTFRFSQTDWFECSDYVTGNYLNYKCASRRRIASILKDFMDEHLVNCMSQTLAVHNFEQMQELHIVHEGILGDPRHSPRSLHAENRAIDIHSFRVEFESGVNKNFVYTDLSLRPFFSDFRRCWGRAVREHNGCPLIQGNEMLTGSIGWEDANHQRHMHTSVPVCTNGRYSTSFFQR